MFVDLMNDVYHTFTERFLRAQLVFSPPEASAPPSPRLTEAGRSRGRGRDSAPARRYNALGILEDVPAGEPRAAEGGSGAGGRRRRARRRRRRPPNRRARQPTVVGAGRTRTLGDNTPANVDWSKVGRNDPCPCGSGQEVQEVPRRDGLNTAERPF